VVENGGELTVSLDGKDVHRSVVFSLASHAISVRDDSGNTMFEVTPTKVDPIVKTIFCPQ
jgi:hypothetical protein